jgi:hypothetical protein
VVRGVSIWILRRRGNLKGSDVGVGGEIILKMDKSVV